MAQSRETQPTRLVKLLRPVDVPKASDVLANELRERILSGELPEGMTLPPERELVSQAGLSRATVREALRILEVQGLVRIRAGRAGGAFVQRPGHESLASSVSLVIRGRRIRLQALMEMREAIEPYCAELAAQRRSDEDLAALDAATEAIAAAKTLPEVLQANIDWHVAVSQASKSDLLAGFMTALSQAIYMSTENKSFVDEEVQRTAYRAHVVITQAIRDQNPAAARRRMERHVHGYATAALEAAERIAQTEIEVPDETVAPVSKRPRNPVVSPAKKRPPVNGAKATGAKATGAKATPAKVAKRRGSASA
jgi:DNA-binding FadR family transcriptional regulator